MHHPYLTVDHRSSGITSYDFSPYTCTTQHLPLSVSRTSRKQTEIFRSRSRSRSCDRNNVSALYPVPRFLARAAERPLRALGAAAGALADVCLVCLRLELCSAADCRGPCARALRGVTLRFHTYGTPTGTHAWPTRTKPTSGSSAESEQSCTR